MVKGAEKSALQDNIKDWITFLGGIGAISYAAGFIVVTTDLLHYGISDFNLLNARYVSAGFFFIFLLCLSMVPAISLIMFISKFFGHELEEPDRSSHIPSRIYSFIKYADSGRTSDTGSGRTSDKDNNRIIAAFKRIFARLILFFMVSLVPPIVIFLTSTKTWLGHEGIKLSSASLILSFISRLISSISVLYPTLLLGWFVPLFITGILLYLIIHLSKKNWPSDISIQLWLLGGVVLCLLWATNNYAFEIYPSTSQAVGGGDAVDVSLVFDNESVQMAKQLFPLDTNFTTAPLRLLDQNDKDYYFLVPDGGTKASFHAVQIDKGLVKGLAYNYTISP